MRKPYLFMFLVVLQACSDPKTRPETADKMKPMLVLVNPPDEAEKPTQPLKHEGWLAPLPGEIAKLQFHFVGPEDLGPLTLTPGEVEPRPLTLPVTEWVVDASIPHLYSGLNHTTIEARTQLPSVAVIDAVWPAFATEGFVRLRYTLVVSDGSRELPLAGDFVVYRDANVAGAARNLFGSTIDQPAAGVDIGDKKLDISSTLRNEQDEDVKIGWYVSAGEIKNRRAAVTEWELPGSGRYTLVFTVRGKESRNGDIQIREVNMP